MAFQDIPSYLSLPRNEHWIVQDLLPTSGLLNLYGPPKEGKSFLAMQLASAIADPAQPDFLGFPIAAHGRVLYLQVDAPRGLFSEMILALGGGGLRFDDVFVADQELVDGHYPFEVTGPGGAWLRGEVDRLSPRTVIVDTLRETYGGDENDSAVMRNVVSALVAATTPAALVLLSHERKPSRENPGNLMTSGRGSSYLVGRMDAIARLAKGKLECQSRSAGYSSFALHRDPEFGLWTMEDPVRRAAREIIQANPGISDVQRARILQAKVGGGRSVESCRAIIRRERSTYGSSPAEPPSAPATPPPQSA